MTFPPGTPQPHAPEPSLGEVLWRLDRLERKLDWIAANAMIPLKGTTQTAADQHQVTTDRADIAEGTRQEPQSVKPKAAGLPADLPPIHRPESKHAAQDRPGDARSKPAAYGSAPARPQMEPAAFEAASRPVSVGVPQTALGHNVGKPAMATAVPPSPQPRALPQLAAKTRSEGNLGRYILSIAAALLVILSAVSLIALVWDQIPDLLKVSGLGAFAGALVCAGAWLAKAKPGQRVAAATITGTGGALGFVAIIGGVLLHEVIPTYPAFGLMVLWSFALLLVSSLIKQVFSAVVSTIGAIITIGFAAWHAFSNPDSALVVWALVAVYLLGLAVITGLLARRASDMPWAAWYPTTARTATSSAVLATPLTPLLGQAPAAGLLVALVPALVLYAQTVHGGLQLWQRGWKSVTGFDWAVTAIVVAVFLVRASTLRADLDQWGVILLIAVLVMLGLAVTSCAVLPTPKDWLRRVSPFLLAASIGLNALGVLKEPRLAALAAVLLIPATIICARSDQAWAVGITAATGLPLFMALYSSKAACASALGAAVVLVALTLITESLLPAAAFATGPDDLAGVHGPAPATPVRQENTATGPAPHGPAAAAYAPGAQRPQIAVQPSREVSLETAKYLLAFVLVAVVPPLCVSVLPISSRNQSLVFATLASVVLLALSYLGLFSPRSTALGILQLRFRGEVPGAATSTQPRAKIMPAGAVFAVLAQVAWDGFDLLTGYNQSLPGRAVMVALACALAAGAIRFLIPWIRTGGAGVAAAVIGTGTFIASSRILVGDSMAGVLTTLVLLLAGAATILLGFKLRATTMRHYGLGLVLVSVFKLALVDLATDNSISRVLALLGAGIVCFLLSLAYNKIAGDADPAARAHAAPPFGAPAGVPGQPLAPLVAAQPGVTPQHAHTPQAQPMSAPGTPPVAPSGPAVGGPTPGPQDQGWYPHDPRQS